MAHQVYSLNEFRCRECGSTRGIIQELRTIQTERIIELMHEWPDGTSPNNTPDEMFLEGDYEDIIDEHGNGYYCRNCGFHLARDQTELIELLLEMGLGPTRAEEETVEEEPDPIRKIVIV